MSSSPETAKPGQPVEQSEGRLAGVLAHQLGAGVAVIDACASMLRDADAEPDVVRALEAVGQRLRRVDENLHDLVRIARRRPSPVLLQPSDVLEGARLEFATDHVHSAVAVHADELPCVYADRTHLERLFVHLLAEVAREGATSITVAATADVDEAVIVIADERATVDPPGFATLLDLSRPPQRLRIAGNSVGLEVCRAIVEWHHGRIGVHYPPGRGLAVAFSLPTSLEAAAGT